jgi:ribonuclease HII
MLKPYFTQGILEAGCDEAGRGCLAGPVFAAAVVLSEDVSFDALNDSKQLSESKRNELRTYIEENAFMYAVAYCTPSEIDRWNILKSSFVAMHRALGNLPFQPAHILVDGNRFMPYHYIPHTCVVKGDAKFQSIAAASILAKTYRDEYMLKLHQEFPQYGFNQHKGYPTELHRKKIQEHGLMKEHRLTFKSL